MKIEVFLQIPYQGSFRFRYDATHDDRVLKSDGAYDRVLNVPAHLRGGPCKELCFNRTSEEKWLPQIEGALTNVHKTLELSKRDTVMTVDLGPTPINMGTTLKAAPRVTAHFVRV